MTLRGLNVLVIDDEPVIRELVSSIIEMEGGSAYAVEGFKSGMKMLQTFQFDVAVIDWLLPNGSGLAMVKQLLDEKPWLGLVLITGLDIETMRIEGLPVRPLAKPFHVKDLVAAVADADSRRTGSRDTEPPPATPKTGL